MKNIFIVLALCLAVYSNHAQSGYSDSLKTDLKNAHEPIERFTLMNSLLEDGYINSDKDPDSSYCIGMLAIAQQLGNDSLLAVAYNQVGNYFFRDKGDFSRALEYFFKAIPFAERIMDKRRVSSLYIDIAAVYSRLNNLEDQIKYARKAMAWLPEKTSSRYHFVAAQVQYYIGAYFLVRNQNDSVLHYAQALNETNLSLKSPMFQSAVFGLMGLVYERRGDTALAELYMERSNLLGDSVRYLYGKVETKLGYINYLLRVHKIAEAKRQAFQLMSIGIEKNDFYVKGTAASFLATIYDNVQQPDRAFYYSRMQSAMKDSIFNHSNLNKIQALAFNEQLRNIEEQSKNAAEVKQREQNLQYVLIALGIICFVMFFMLLSRRHITNTKVIEFLGVVILLVVFEFLNLLLHPFLERLTHHSPLLMLLSLVLIAALLVPLHHRMEKWATHQLIEQNRMARLRAARKTIDRLEKIEH